MSNKRNLIFFVLPININQKMSINQTSILSIISENAINSINAKNDEFFKWLIMQVLVKDNKFREEDIEAVVKHYQPIEDDNIFLDLQLKFFFGEKIQEIVKLLITI